MSWRSWVERASNAATMAASATAASVAAAVESSRRPKPAQQAGDGVPVTAYAPLPTTSFASPGSASPGPGRNKALQR